MSCEDNLIKIKFSIHIYTNGTELTESEVDELLTHVCHPLKLNDAHNVTLEDKYQMKDDAEVIRFVDQDGHNMSSIRFLKKLCKSQRATLNGTAEIRSSDILNLIDVVCCNLPDHIISWSCRPDSGCNFFEISPDELSTSIEVTSFRFGNIINGNRFVSHLNDFHTKGGSRFGLMSDITVRISHRTQEIILRFKISYCVGTSHHDQLKHIRCKFIFDFQSIMEIITSVNYASEFYLKLDYPPKFLVKEGNNWNQWSDCDIISREIIGKCKILRLRIEADDSEDMIDSMIPEFYSIFANRTCDIICVSMENYCIDYAEDATKGYNLPFEVKYTLQCIDSLSYAFADDLIVNNNKETFYRLVENLIQDGKTVLVIEALTRLFNSYFYGNPEVLDAFDSFNCLIQTIEEENEVSSKNEDKLHYLKRIVLTPMRTIYLPPSSSETKFISGNVNISRLIKVHLRDDDHSHACTSPYPYLSEDFGEFDFSYQFKDAKCKSFFLKQVIGKRLFGENGLLSKNSYKYHGTALTDLFMDGIILEAEVDQGVRDT